MWTYQLANKRKLVKDDVQLEVSRKCLVPRAFRHLNGSKTQEVGHVRSIRVRNTASRRTYYTYITSSHLGVGAGRGLCLPNRSTSLPNQPLVRYGNHMHVVCPRTWSTNGKLSLAPTKRTSFDSLFDYNVFITIYVPQRFGKPQQVQCRVFAITPTTDYVPLAPSVFKFPL